MKSFLFSEKPISESRVALRRKGTKCRGSGQLFSLVVAVLIFIFEYKNPLTIGDLSFFDKIQVSIFQSVTTRTAGFASVPQENLTNATTLLCLILMFIGGSPVGTAGGVKTVTIFVLLISTFGTIKNKNQATTFKRTVSPSSISKEILFTAFNFVNLLTFV